MRGVLLSVPSTDHDRVDAAVVSAETSSPAVIVAVGTDHHPFDRMIRWIDTWAAKHPDIDVLVQRGTSEPTAVCRSVDLLPHPELCENFARARAVVSHGGPSTVMDARMAGRLPIVMARNPEFAEHVDDHQMRFADHLERHELASVVSDEQALHDALDAALADPDDYTVPIDASSITGVVEFGRVMDQLLQTTTPLIPSSPAGVDELQPRHVETVSPNPAPSQSIREQAAEASLEGNRS